MSRMLDKSSGRITVIQRYTDSFRANERKKNTRQRKINTNWWHLWQRKRVGEREREKILSKLWAWSFVWFRVYTRLFVWRILRYMTYYCTKWMTIPPIYKLKMLTNPQDSNSLFLDFNLLRTIAAHLLYFTIDKTISVKKTFCFAFFFDEPFFNQRLFPNYLQAWIQCFQNGFERKIRRHFQEHIYKIWWGSNQ